MSNIFCTPQFLLKAFATLLFSLLYILMYLNVCNQIPVLFIYLMMKFLIQRHQKYVYTVNAMKRQEEFDSMISPIVTSLAWNPMRSIHHHDASLASHSIKVARVVFRLTRVFGFRRTRRDLVRGALLHDFFLYDWRKPKTDDNRHAGLHGLMHPRTAFTNAELHFGPMSRREKDCILRHMWPLTLTPPKYLESLIVCIADKWVSLRESLSSLLSGRGLGVL